MAAPENLDNVLNAAERHALPASMFAVPGHQGLPLEDANHVRDAMARFDQEHYTSPSERQAAYHHIVARAHQLGIDSTGFQKKYGDTRTDQKEMPAMDELQKQLATAMQDAANAKAALTAAQSELATTKAALTTAQTDAANAKADLAVAQTAVTNAKAAATAAEQAAKDAVAQAKLDAASATSAEVASRVQLLTEANKVLGDKSADGKPVDRVSMDELDIRIAVITQVDGAEFVGKLPEAQKKDPAFVRGLYAGSLGRFDTAAASRAGVQQHLNQIRATGVQAAVASQDVAPTVSAEQRERAAMINRTRRAQ
jgi:hypothetical protein